MGNFRKERGYNKVKRSLFVCILVLVFSLSFAVQAKDETMLEETWNNFITTTELDYLPEEGEVNLNFFSTKFDTADVDLMDSWVMGYGFNGGYGLKGIEVTGYFEGKTLFNEETEDTSWSHFGGSIKAHLLDHNGFLVAAKASVDEVVNAPKFKKPYGLGVYTDKIVDDSLRLHNNLLFDIDEESVVKRLYNGFDYKFNEHHALKAYLYTGFVNIDSLYNSVNLLYRNNFNDQAAFLSGFRKVIDEDNLLFFNLVEVKPSPDLIVSGYYQFNTVNQDWLGIDVRKEFTNFKLAGGCDYSEDKDKQYGSIDYELKKGLNLELILMRERETVYYYYRRGIYDSFDDVMQEDYVELTIKTGISYSL